MLERLRPEVYGDAKQGGGPAVVVQVNTFDGTQTDGVVTARGVTIQQQPAQQITQQLAIDADAITIDLGDWGAA